MKVTQEGLCFSGWAPSDNDNVCVFNGIVSSCATYWILRFQDGPAWGDRGPFPLDPPEQFDTHLDENGVWVLTPCSAFLSLPDDHVRYERISMASLSDEEAEERQVIRGAVYRVVQ